MPFEFNHALDTLDNVPEHFRGLYTKAEGGNGFAIHPEFAGHISGLSSALDKERKNAKTASAGLTAWKALGETPEAVAQTITELKDQLAKKGDGAANFEKLKADLEKGHSAVLGEKDKSIGRMQESLNRYLIDNAATAAIAEAKGAIPLLLPIIRTAVKVVEENGEYIVRVLDKDGDARGNGSGGFMTIKDYVAELKNSKDYGRAFEASGQTGGGKPPASGKTGGGAGRDASELTPTQKIAMGLGKGQLRRP
jgi:hypothetical protein